MLNFKKKLSINFFNGSVLPHKQCILRHLIINSRNLSSGQLKIDKTHS